MFPSPRRLPHLDLVLRFGRLPRGRLVGDVLARDAELLNLEARHGLHEEAAADRLAGAFLGDDNHVDIVGVSPLHSGLKCGTWR